MSLTPPGAWPASGGSLGQPRRAPLPAPALFGSGQPAALAAARRGEACPRAFWGQAGLLDVSPGHPLSGHPLSAPSPRSYVVYDPAARAFSEDKQEMRAQLEKAWPVHTYPWVILTPDGGVVMSAGSTLVGARRGARGRRAVGGRGKGVRWGGAVLSAGSESARATAIPALALISLTGPSPRTQVKYDRSDDTTFARAYEMAPRPHAPWSYPQTGQGVLLPLSPPYTQCALGGAAGPGVGQGGEAGQGSACTASLAASLNQQCLLAPYFTQVPLHRGGRVGEGQGHQLHCRLGRRPHHRREQGAAAAAAAGPAGPALASSGPHCGRSVPAAARCRACRCEPRGAGRLALAAGLRARLAPKPRPRCPLAAQLNAGEGAEWRDIGPMPYPRVLGDATMLCDGTIVFMGGGEKGIAVRAWGAGRPARILRARQSHALLKALGAARPAPPT